MQTLKTLDLFCKACWGACPAKRVSSKAWTGSNYFHGGLLSLGTGRGTRGFKTGIVGNWTKDASEGDSLNPEGVLRNWTKSILSQTVKTEDLEGESQAVKRPSAAVYQKFVSEPPPLVKKRRRLSDNSWTSTVMDTKIIWVDCEMTGLNPDVDKLIEIGVIITDKDLNVIATQDSIVFHVEDSVLDSMHPWCVQFHGKSGLTDAVRKSTITHESADEDLLKFLQKYTTAGECPMAGNSIGQDRGFIRRQLPKFHSHFHYRDIDVSSIKELARRWFPEAHDAVPRKKRSHRVLDDIRESIEELQYYRSTVFKSPRDVQVRVASSKH